MTEMLTFENEVILEEEICDPPLDVFEFYVYLEQDSPRLCCLIQIPGIFTFQQLHEIIQKSMGRTFVEVNNLHAFAAKNPSTSLIDRIVMADDMHHNNFFTEGDVRNEEQTKIDTYFKNPGDTAIYEFNFNRNGNHVVELRNIFAVKYDEHYLKSIEDNEDCSSLGSDLSD